MGKYWLPEGGRGQIAWGKTGGKTSSLTTGPSPPPLGLAECLASTVQLNQSVLRDRLPGGWREGGKVETGRNLKVSWMLDGKEIRKQVRGKCWGRERESRDGVEGKMIRLLQFLAGPALILSLTDRFFKNVNGFNK